MIYQTPLLDYVDHIKNVTNKTISVYLNIRTYFFIHHKFFVQQVVIDIIRMQECQNIGILMQTIQL